MNLSAEQLEAVRAWVAEGDTLSEVQKKLRSEFNLQMTSLMCVCLLWTLARSLKIAKLKSRRTM